MHINNYILHTKIAHRIENPIYITVSKGLPYNDYDLFYSFFFNNDLTHYQERLEIEYLDSR